MRALGHTAAIALVIAALAATPAHGALGLAVGTPPPALALKPGETATASGTLVVTRGPLDPEWTLSAEDDSGNNGHLAPASGTCAGVTPLTTNPLSVTATGQLAGTVSFGPKRVSSDPAPLARGLLGDTLTVTYSLVVQPDERLQTACTMQTVVTYTLTAG